METIRAIYHLAASAATIAARAEALALEQSVEMPAAAIRSDYVRAVALARVAAVAPCADDRYAVTIELSVATTGPETGQLMNMLFGNCSLQQDVQLVDVLFPPSVLDVFPGPRHGIAGIRKAVRAWDRPLTCTALKPLGLSPDELAAMCGTFARAGLDVIKDDHGIADQVYAPFAGRVRACQRAIEQAARETGHRACYAPSLSGGPRRLEEQLRIVAGEGVAMVLAAPMVMGLPVFTELVRERLAVPVLAHPALSGALRIAPPLFYGRLFRLFGADAVIFPNYGGRFSYSQATCLALADAARGPFGSHAPSLPVPAGGMSVERVAEMLSVYGTDTMLLIGGALLAAGDALFERSREFVSTVRAGSRLAADATRTG